MTKKLRVTEIICSHFNLRNFQCTKNILYNFKGSGQSINQVGKPCKHGSLVNKNSFAIKSKVTYAMNIHEAFCLIDLELE